MPLSAHLLLAATALCCIGTMFAIPMEGFSLGHQCRCLTTTSNFINSRFLKKIMIIPAGSNCANVEFIITLKDNRVVCMDTEAEWVQKLINKLIKGRKLKIEKRDLGSLEMTKRADFLLTPNGN